MLSPENLQGKKITVMGLGLNGGGVAAARFLAQKGAQVTVTDLRSPDILKPSLELLEGLEIRYRLGEHRLEDFSAADLVIKNPAVPKDSPFLLACPRYETDISLFLQMTDCPILAVTGSKGKSSTVSLLHHILKESFSQTFLGGNITFSPLNFIDKVARGTPVVLELSSWQLADLPDPSVLSPKVAVLTNIMHDHQNKYASLQDYINDKKIIVSHQKAGQFAVLPDNSIGREFAEATAAEIVFFSEEGNRSPAHENRAWLDSDGGWLRLRNETNFLFSPELRVPGKPFRVNALIAAVTARLLGVSENTIQRETPLFQGVEHRLEIFMEKNGIRYCNDTAATIPDAAAEAVKSFECPIRLITGGTDKDLQFDPLLAVLDKPVALYLLTGTATDRLIPLLEERKIAYNGPYSVFHEAVVQARKDAEPGDVILLSPGAASFGMFLNEFDRGRQFKEIVRGLP